MERSKRVPKPVQKFEVDLPTTGSRSVSHNAASKAKDTRKTRSNTNSSNLVKTTKKSSKTSTVVTQTHEGSSSSLCLIANIQNFNQARLRSPQNLKKILLKNLTRSMRVYLNCLQFLVGS